MTEPEAVVTEPDLRKAAGGLAAVTLVSRVVGFARGIVLVRAVGSASSTCPAGVHIWGSSAPTGSTEKSCRVHSVACALYVTSSLGAHREAPWKLLRGIYLVQHVAGENDVKLRPSVGLRPVHKGCSHLHLFCSATSVGLEWVPC